MDIIIEYQNLYAFCGFVSEFIWVLLKYQA